MTWLDRILFKLLLLLAALWCAPVWAETNMCCDGEACKTLVGMPKCEWIILTRPPSAKIKALEDTIRARKKDKSYSQGFCDAARLFEADLKNQMPQSVGNIPFYNNNEVDCDAN